jgi:YihY family inner membrane protein
VRVHAGGDRTLNLWRRLYRRLDHLQRATRPTAIAVAVVKKYGGDRGGALAALVTYYGFLSLFPLLLLLVTVVGLAVGPHSGTEQRIVNSALSEFPVVGTELGKSIHALHRATPLAFVVSALGLLWGSLGVTNTMQRASAVIWDVPRRTEPDLRHRVWRSVRLLGVIAVAVLGSAVLTGLSTIGGGKVSASPAGYWALSLVGAAVVNLGAYLLAFHILAPAGTPWRTLLPGTVVGGVGWTALETLGGVLIDHFLRHATELYGFFAIVLGLMFWLSLGSQLFVYASETNVVVTRHLWPRHLDDPPPADREGEASTRPPAQVAGSANS